MIRTAGYNLPRPSSPADPAAIEARRAERRRLADIEHAGILRLVATWPAGYTVKGKRTPGSGIPGFIADTAWTITAPNGEVVGNCIVDTATDAKALYARDVHAHAGRAALS